ncbi:MAG: hypothetical protein WA197_21920 [Candidatus Acidiferrales bacterium]
MRRITRALVGVLCVGMGALVIGPFLLAQDNDSILKNLHKISTIASTVPTNQDVNPYGVALVKRTVGNLTEGHVLVSNFNNFSNLQGTGTTIVEIAPNGSLSLFAQIDPTALPGPCPGGVGLTTALAVLKSGWVIVGSLPTADGTSATAQAGCLIVLDSSGKAVETFYGSLINGPWDMAAFDGGDEASLFVTNVLNGTVAAGGSVVNQGTVLRIDLAVSANSMPSIESMTVVGSGFAERTDPAALVIGLTGVGLSPNCGDSDANDCSSDWRGQEEPALYVADTLNNRITVIPHPMGRDRSAGTGFTLSTGGSLNAPLGLTVAEGGHILTVNGGDGFITEITPRGSQIAKTMLDSSGTPPGSGALFGLIFEPGQGVVFVDDATNTLNLLH